MRVPADSGEQREAKTSCAAPAAWTPSPHYTAASRADTPQQQRKVGRAGSSAGWPVRPASRPCDAPTDLLEARCTN